MNTSSQIVAGVTPTQWETCFDFLPVPATMEECAAIADQLERQLERVLPAVRFQEMRAKLTAWDLLTEKEREDFAACMGWRRAMFLGDDWLWRELDFTGTRSEFRAWSLTQLSTIRQCATSDQLSTDKAAIVASADRTLALDLSRDQAPGKWVHRDVVDWTPTDKSIDNEVVTTGLRLHPHHRLARGFSVTGDTKYLTMMCQLLADITWVIPGNALRRAGVRGPVTHWGADALDVASRTTSLMWLYALTADALDADMTVLVWKTLYFCGARAQEFWHKKPHNIIFYEAGALGVLGFCFPSFRQAKLWRESAQQRLIGALKGSIMSDGSNVEGAFLYQEAYLSCPQRLVNAAQFSGLPIDPQLEEVWRRKRKAMLELWTKIITPTGTLPPLGDASMMDIRERLAFYSERFGVTATPAKESCFLRVQRYAVMRGQNGFWCGFNLRGFHQGHDHYDLFHVELMRSAQRLLLDTGCIDYDANRERSRASASHNTLVVDEKDHRDGAAVDIRWESTATFDWAEGLSPRTGHRRAVCFLKPDVFLILDRVEPSDNVEHQYDLYYHLPVDCDARVEGQTVHFAGTTLQFLADDKWTLTMETGLITPTAFAPPAQAPVIHLQSKRAGGFAVATVINAAAINLPVSVFNAADGEPIRALAVQVGESAVLWCAPGFGEKRFGKWTSLAERFIDHRGVSR